MNVDMSHESREELAALLPAKSCQQHEAADAHKRALAAACCCRRQGYSLEQRSLRRSHDELAVHLPAEAGTAAGCSPRLGMPQEFSRSLAGLWG